MVPTGRLGDFWSPVWRLLGAWTGVYCAISDAGLKILELGGEAPGEAPRGGLPRLAFRRSFGPCRCLLVVEFFGPAMMVFSSVERWANGKVLVGFISSIDSGPNRSSGLAK